MSRLLTPTAAQVVQRRVVNQAVVNGAQRLWMDAWGAIDVTRPEVAQGQLLRLNNHLVTEFGNASSTLAADFYDQARSQAGVRGGFRALTMPPDTVGMDAATRRLSRHLFGTDPNKLVNGTLAMLDVLIKRASRDTIIDAAQTEGRVRYARIPTSAEPCRFCLMQASRGFVFRDAMSAGDMNMGAGFHNACQCEVVPSWDQNNPHVDGYDPDDLRRRWRDADIAWEERTGGNAVEQWRQASERAAQRNRLARNARRRADYAERRRAAGETYRPRIR